MPLVGRVPLSQRPPKRPTAILALKARSSQGHRNANIAVPDTATPATQHRLDALVEESAASAPTVSGFGRSVRRPANPRAQVRILTVGLARRYAGAAQVGRPPTLPAPIDRNKGASAAVAPLHPPGRRRPRAPAMTGSPEEDRQTEEDDGEHRRCRHHRHPLVAGSHCTANSNNYHAL